MWITSFSLFGCELVPVTVGRRKGQTNYTAISHREISAVSSEDPGRTGELAGIVRRMIEKGELAHLDPVPSESSLVQTYGVSRDTARRAMALLRDEDVVFTVPHRGTYVGPRPKLRPRT
jgi:GntR family transcriptional regulator